MSRQLLFSVTRDDCDWQTFRAGGKGGQNQNKVSSGGFACSESPDAPEPGARIPLTS